MGLYDQNKNNSLHGKNIPTPGMGQKGPGPNIHANDPAKHSIPNRGAVPAPSHGPMAGKSPDVGPKAGSSLGAHPTNVQKANAMPMKGNPQGSQGNYQHTVSTPQKTVDQKNEPSHQSYQKTVASPSTHSYQKTVASPSKPGYQKTVNWAANGGAAGAAASSLPYTVGFSEKINYMDPVYGLLELNFAGSVVVSSNEHREGLASTELVRNVVKSTLTQKLSQLAASQKSMREIFKEYSFLKDSCVKSLGIKNFDVSRVNLNGFTLTEKSKEKIDNADNAPATGRMNSRDLQRQLDEEAQRSGQAYFDNMNHMGYNQMQDPYQAQMMQNQMYQGQMNPMGYNQMQDPYQAQMMQNQINQAQMYPDQMNGQMNPMGYNQMQDPYQAQMMQNQMNQAQMYPNQMNGQMNPMGYNQMQDPYQAQMMQNQMNGQMYPDQMQGQMNGQMGDIAAMAQKMANGAKVGMDGAPIGSAAGAFAGAVGAVAQAMGAGANQAMGAVPATFCPQCGTQNAGSAFCMNCGAKL